MNPPLPLLEPEWIAKLSDRTTAADLPNDMTVLRRIVHDLMTLAWQDRQQLRANAAGHDAVGAVARARAAVHGQRRRQEKQETPASLTVGCHCSAVFLRISKNQRAFCGSFPARRCSMKYEHGRSTFWLSPQRHHRLAASGRPAR
jgi:hypothetical protein